MVLSWFNIYVCLFVYTFYTLYKTFKLYTLPYVSSTNTNYDDDDNYDVDNVYNVKASSFITDISLNSYDSDTPLYISVSGFWGTVFEWLNNDILFDESGCLSNSLPLWVMYIFSLFRTYSFRQIILVSNYSEMIPLSSTPVQIPPSTTTLFVIYNINPFLLCVLSPNLDIHLEQSNTVHNK